MVLAMLSRLVLAMICLMVDSLTIQTKRKAMCQGDDSSWDAGFGGCDAYGPTREHHMYCSSDVDSQGLLASQVCPDCGKCVAAGETEAAQLPEEIAEAERAYETLFTKDQEDSSAEKRISNEDAERRPYTLKELLDLNNGDEQKTQQMWADSTPVEDPEEEEANKTMAKQDDKATWCQSGIINGEACCAASCGECGGAGCFARPGGTSQCCTASFTSTCTSTTQVACSVQSTQAAETIPVETKADETSVKAAYDAVTRASKAASSNESKADETIELYLCTITEDSSAEHVSPGDKWLVKSAEVSIQGRYHPQHDGDALDRGNVFMRAVAIGGEFLHGNTMIIGSFRDGITWNGEKILEEQTSSFTDLSANVKARRSPKSSLVQDLSVENPGVNVELSNNVSLVVNRLLDWVNVAIKMPIQKGGQEGLCGSTVAPAADEGTRLDSESSDETSQWNVPSEETLFLGEKS